MNTKLIDLRKTAIATLCLAVLATSACDGGAKPGGAAKNDNKGIASRGELIAEEAPAKTGELFAISDAQIGAYKIEDGKQIRVTGEQRAEMLAAIPVEMKKGAGQLMPGIASIQKSFSGTGYLAGFGFKVSGKADYIALKDYYKSLGGTVTSEGETKTGAAWLTIDFAWGRLSDCQYRGNTIHVSFSTK
jgi:hypothetical protein